MNPRDTQEQIGLFAVTRPAPGAAEIDVIRAQAAQARDAAIAAMLGRAVVTIGRALAVVGTTLLTWPQRRATYDNLRTMSDRQLEDIGLTRGDIARVFEPEFRMPTRPANANKARPARPLAA